MSVAVTETEAAELEGIRPASKDAMTLIRRFQTLAKRMKPVTAEQNAIKDLLKEEMSNTGTKKLTHKGVVVVELVTVNGRNVDLAGILKEFPGAAKYVTPKPSTRFDVK